MIFQYHRFYCVSFTPNYSLNNSPTEIPKWIRRITYAYEAEDAAQEIFLRAYTRLDSYNNEYNFSTWLFSIASHYCIDQLRKRRRICWISWDSMEFWHIAPNEKSFQPEEALIEAETTREVHALLNSLSPDQRAAIILKYWYKMSYQEIAQTLNSTVSTVRNRLFRARKAMARSSGWPTKETLVSFVWLVLFSNVTATMTSDKEHEDSTKFTKILSALFAFFVPFVLKSPNSPLQTQYPSVIQK